MDTIPLTTRETQYLRSQYPCIEHLEAGNVGSWLVERREQLLGKAEEERLGMNIVKTFGILATTAGALCYATSPLAPIGGIIAAVGYGWAVLEDMNASHKFAPLPFIRGSFIEFLSAMGDRSEREEYFASQNAEVELIFHLDPFEQKEYAMLLEFTELVTEYLMGVEAGKRFYAYRWLLSKYRNFRTLPDQTEMAGHLENVELDPRVEVEAIGQLQIQTEQKKLSLIEQQRARCVKLPNQPRRVLPEESGVNFPQPLGQALEVPSHPVEPSFTPFTTKLPDSSSRPVEATEITTPATHPPEVTSRPIEPLKPLTIVLFDFNRLRAEPDKFAHLRVIGGTGVGKTTFVDWLLDVLGGSRFVITPKKKSWNWVGLKVYGLWFDYETIRQKLQWIHAEMYRRYPLMEAGQTFEITNFVVDEWRLINTNVKAIRERDPETKQSIEVAPSAKAMMKDIITVARESMLRLIALAQGENVASWGFEGESDLEECFTDIRLGEFAIDYAKSLRNQCRKDSDDYEYWTAVLHELEWQNEQRTREGKSIPCCMVGKHPARIPDLTDWKREVSDNPLEENEQTNLLVTDPSTQPSQEAILPERKLPPTDVEGTRKPDGISVEVFSARIEEALAEASGEASSPLLEGLERDGKLLMLRLLLTKNLGKEKTILLAWGQKSGGRNHEKYKYASDLLDAMIGELNGLGFHEENNWGVNE